MNREQVRNLLESVKSGDLATADALEKLSTLRHGIPEVIYAPGKTPQQIVEIVSALRSAEQDVLVTRIEADVAGCVLEEIGGGTHDALGRLLWYGPAEVPAEGKGTIAVVTAGTSDLPVA
ncbi:MAG: 1-(5-phosphoribosyl)-5-amino-4-imidazole-carboxylate carboxylase, partial [Deltaproteobacteria bacterium]|nr:1-(5-phosphoribosyl)-5-amino-4-imidazole-carboxylate carboxylase [Deltaproteobacteria bacterium]